MLYRNGNFCSFCRRKCTIPVVGDLKKITGYSYMGETLNLLCSESFAAEMLMGCFSLTLVTYINVIDLFARAYSRLVTRLLCLCFTSEKKSLSSAFFVSYCFLFAYVMTNHSTPGVRKQTQRHILFKIGINSSLLSHHTEKNVLSFHSCL